MRKFLLASHGRFAEGIYDSLCMIMGKQYNVSTICAYVDPTVDLKQQIKAALEHYEENEEVIIITDIFGGSINNEFMNISKQCHIHLISGLNLPLLIELISTQTSENSTEQWLEQTISLSKDAIQYCNNKMNILETSGDDF
ncbi:PTS sugar transporter subunit IIA [Bacillus circulans]|jgi:fructoselysine/glucoselysine PTS system EIIA component|uniref:PTS EIIA type-4 domain-containing protein n=1 Tax=Niallia circulans TaxID=1397 RepID=A0AA91TSX0_NIACI|nr:PTS sugar transporter subunit IIA [Niallia circulans]AYV73697.1 PTS system fructose subfamily transporter subunit IIA [Niallia circulans]NRG28886.1 PTS sugar transporter subunit IIA [Niallia circulans]PAD83580.1 hypothetical protein CHH57_08950 [Niallia circulans]